MTHSIEPPDFLVFGDKNTHEIFERAGQLFRAVYNATHPLTRENIDELLEDMNFNRVFLLSNLDRVSDGEKNTLRTYLESLPEFRADKGVNQSQVTLDNHAYLQHIIIGTVRQYKREHAHSNDNSLVDVVHTVFREGQWKFAG